MKNIIRVSIFSNAQCAPNGPSTNLIQFNTWFTQKLKSIPAEYQGSARVELSSVEGYDGVYDANISVFYNRPETDAEVSKREVVEAQLQALRNTEELLELARLTAKYGSAK